MPRGLLQLLVALLLAAPLGRRSAQVLDEMGVDRPYDVAYVPEPENLLALSPALRITVANAYWLSFVQYIGDPKARERGFEKLFAIADLVTTLDPKHGYAYQTAGVVLSNEGYLDESDRILIKGIEQGPNWWSYPFYIAFNHFFFRGDPAEAARWAERAARTPGASPRIAALAMTMRVRSGSPEDAMRFVREMMAGAKDETTLAVLTEQYNLALLQREFARLDQAVERFRLEHGRAPARLDELVAARMLEAVPADPFGGRFYLGADGKVHASGRDKRFKPQEAFRRPTSMSAPPAPRRPPEAP